MTDRIMQITGHASTAEGLDDFALSQALSQLVSEMDTQRTGAIDDDVYDRLDRLEAGFVALATILNRRT